MASSSARRRWLPRRARSESRRGPGSEPGDRDDTESVVVINRTARDYLFPDGNAIGGNFTWGGLPSELTVVGVVEDIKYEEEMGLPPERQGFIPMRQSARLDAGLLVEQRVILLPWLPQSARRSRI